MRNPIRYSAGRALRAALKLFRGAGLSRAIALVLSFTLSVGTGLAAQAQPGLPEGGRVTAGSATVSRTANQLVVNQATDRLSMNWQSFDIGAGNSVRFDQPSADSIALNRVLGGNRSEIYGKLSANGQVFLVNPNGILFGRSAQVDVGGLVASTLNITNRDFLDGDFTFSGSSGAGVVNEGDLTARDGGYLALIGDRVKNSGTMQAQLGSIVLGAGGAAQLELADSKLVRFEVTQGALDALAKNGGLIRADGGRVVLTAGARESLLASTVNNSGVIEARTVERQAGNILLLAGMQAGVTQVGGTLDASAPASLNPGGGDGGFIETSGAQVRVRDDARITTQAADGRTGKWLIDPRDYTITAAGGDISGTALSAALANNNVEIQSSGGGAEGNGDINVDDAVSWNANELTLTAARDININAVMTANGSSSLVLNTGAANGADSGVADGTVKVGLDPATGFAGRVDFDRSGSGFLTINGEDYTVIADVNELQAVSSNVSGRYALGAQIDASATAGWNAGAGFATIDGFSGVFDGLGHTISGLTINRSSSTRVGLFGLMVGANVRNLGLAGGSVSGSDEVGALSGNVQGSRLHNILSSVDVWGTNAGGLVGVLEDSTVTDAHASGDLFAQEGTGPNNRGGLIGLGDGNTLTRVSASGNLIGGPGGGGNKVGGLIGESFSDAITDASASGDILGNGIQQGGLIGTAFETVIANSHATGNVGSAGSNRELRGGLVGEMIGGSIADSYATGTVHGGSDIGGLVGRNTDSAITGSYATGDVTGIGDRIGGLVGSNTAAITGSYATGNVMGTGTGDRIGGLVGENLGALTDVRAEGNVSGASRVGGLVGYNAATIDGASAGVAGGSVIATGDYVGGLVGYNDGGSISGTSTAPVLARANVTGDASWVGGAIGYNRHAHLTYVSASGAVLSTETEWNGSADITIGGGRFVGGLVGEHAGGTIEHGTASGDVQGRLLVGGLAGQLSADPVAGPIASNLISSSASGDVRIVTDDELGNPSRAGGLVGRVHSAQTLRDLEASGDVDGGVTGSVGGLIGELLEIGVTLERGAASGNVQGGRDVGGLVGRNFANITGSRAHGNVTASINAGGLVGFQDVADITRSYAEGNVMASGNNVGGLMGNNHGVLIDVYALGGATGASNVGGLTGSNVGTIERSYASGLVSGADAVGGLVGSGSSTVTSSYWDITGTGQTTSAGGTGLTSEQMKQIASFSDWDIARTGGSSAVWRIYEGHTAPLLRNFLEPLTLAGAPDMTTTYNGTIQSGGAAGLSNPLVLGAAASGRNAGFYNGYYSTQQGYDIIGGNLSIERANLTLSTSNVTKTYDGTVSAAGTLIVAGGTLFGGDSLGGGSFAFTDKNAGSGNKTVTVNGATVNDGNGGANYNLSYVDNTTSTINRAALSASGITANDKVYDGTTVASLNTSAAIFSGIIGDDDVALPLSGVTANFSDKNVGADKTVNLSAAELSGADAGNYMLTATAPVTADITPAALTISGITANNKVYDGTVAATVNTGGAIYSGLIGGDDLTVSVSGAFSDKNAGTAKTVTLSSGYSGADVNNYTITGQAMTTADITPKALAISGITASDKVYDGTATATVDTGGVIYSGLIGGDAVTVSASGTFSDKNAGAAKTVTLSSSYNGADLNNYTITGQATTTADITRKALTVSGITANDKVYDGTSVASLDTSSGAMNGVIAGDVVSLPLSGVTANFADKHVGMDKTVNLSGAALSGADAGNYMLTSLTPLTADITPAALMISGITANNKVYDGTVAATVNTGGAIYSGLIGGDDLTVSVSGAFSDKNAGTAKTVTLSSSYSGADAGNYLITGQATTSADITPRQATVTANDLSKTYGDTYNFTGSEFTATGLVAGETIGVSLASAGSAANATVAGGPYAITVSGAAGGGFDPANYILSYVEGSLTVNRAPLTIAANGDTRVYDGSAYSGGNGVVYTGFVNGETSAVLGGSLSYGGSAQGAVNAGAYSIAPGGLTADNYAISYADGLLIITEIAEMQAATTAAKQIDMTFGGFDEAGHQPVNFAIVGAGIRLPQEEE